MEERQTPTPKRRRTDSDEDSPVSAHSADSPNTSNAAVSFQCKYNILGKKIKEVAEAEGVSEKEVFFSVVSFVLNEIKNDVGWNLASVWTALKMAIAGNRGTDVCDSAPTRIREIFHERMCEFLGIRMSSKGLLESLRQQALENLEEDPAFFE